MKFKVLSLLFMLFVIFSCNNNEKNDSDAKKNDETDKLSGNVTVFHAGSLALPFKEMKKEFEKLNPSVKILLEGAGSVASERKISDLKRECGIMASADYKVIHKLLIPEFTDTCVNFASNELVIAFNEKSKYASEINTKNWDKILLRSDVKYGRSEPDLDPCGYRTVLMWQLQEMMNHIKDFELKMLEKDNELVRPKETDLLSLMETNSIDYMFQYKSVAEQHHLKYILLSDSVNLGINGLADFYKNASMEIKGKKPGKTMTITGSPMIYGVTMLKNAPNPKATKAFFDFILSEKGIEIMESFGQKSLLK